MKFMAKALKLTSARAAKAAFFASLISAVPTAAKTDKDLAQFGDPNCRTGNNVAELFDATRQSASDKTNRETAGR